MCGYGLHNVKSRRAKVGDKLTARQLWHGHARVAPSPTPGDRSTIRPLPGLVRQLDRCPMPGARRPASAINSASYPQCCPNCEGVLAAGVCMASQFLNAVSTARRISRVAVVGMLLDGGVSPRKTAAPCGSNRILSENLRQRVRELTVNCRNARSEERLRPERVRPFASAPRH